jgi:hypothetical protein
MKSTKITLLLCFSLFILIVIPAESSETKLEVLTTTMTQIVLQWENVPANASSTVLERATNKDFTENPKSYSLEKGINVFSDTDREPVSKSRFFGDKRGSLLDPTTEYYYRIKCAFENGDPKYSNIVSAKVSKPVRGKEGDLWADVVLGKSSFGENVNYHPTKYTIYYPGGVLIDKTVKPNRMYIADCNNNRILGFKSTSPKDGADIVLGQPDFESCAGNGDSCAQLFPYRQSSSAKTLCLTDPTQISIGETVVKISMTLDEKGNLYVPDAHNNRILKYNDPFGTDCIADEVWGQADFSGNEPNRGTPKPANNTFNLDGRSGVTFDLEGNLWVADYINNRVLRFPKNAQTGLIAKEADIVLGQPDFTTNGDYGYKRTLTQLWAPSDVEFDAKGNLYVSDGISNAFDGRVVVFEPPFKSGMVAARKMTIPNDPQVNQEGDVAANTTLIEIVKDINPNYMWFEEGTFASKLIDLESGKIITVVRCDQSSGIDVDSDGNLYTVGKWSGVFRYPSSSWNLTWDERRKLVEKIISTGNKPTAGSIGGTLGITTFKDQLIIAENSRLLIWNKFNINKVKNGEPADDVYGEKDFSSILFNTYISSCQSDKSGRLWISNRTKGMHSTAHHVLEAFQYPMTRNSKPVKTIPLMSGNEKVLSVLGGEAIHTVEADFIDFTVSGTGDKIWVADRIGSRILRINNVDGKEDPKQGPYVDIVLGQNNLTDIDRKEKIGPRMLAWPYNVDISPKGEIYIADNGGEVGSNRRIIIYKPERFPEKPAKCLFADDIGDPDMVIGTGGRFDIPGYDNAVTDPMCCPFEVGISKEGTIVAGMNGYSAQRFPLVYLYPAKTTQPQMALGDFTAYPTTCFIDDDGNVYIGDFDWSRVLIYKKPFKKIKY